MANTYTQIYVHLIFAVKYRASLIPREHKAELQKFITGIITNQKCKLIAIENEPDHIHILIGLPPDTSLSDLVRDIKANSSRWINEQEWMKFEFRWQEGYGAFSYSRSQLGSVIAYIQNQEAHHKKQTFHEAGGYKYFAPTELGTHGSSSVRSAIFVAPCVSANIAGVPAISVPVGLDASGLPIGAQLMYRDFDEAERIRRDAKALEDAGVFSIVLEKVLRSLAREVTESLRVSTIGIGAGPHCDGQVLVMHDLLGLTEEFHPRFVRKYATLADTVRTAVQHFNADIKSGPFPSEEESY